MVSDRFLTVGVEIYNARDIYMFINFVHAHISINISVCNYLTY